MSSLATSQTYRRAIGAATAAVAALALGVMGIPQASAAPPQPAHDSGHKGSGHGREDRATVDVRQGSSAAQRKALERRAAIDGQKTKTKKLRTALGAQGVLDIDGLTGTPRQVARLDGFLTAPSSKRAHKVALGYVRGNLGAFGLSAKDLADLRLARDYVDIEGIHHLSWVQYAAGVPLFGNGLKANVTADGRLISVLGSPVARLSAPASAGTKLVPTGAAAIARARTDLTEPSTAAGPDDTSRAVLFQTTGGTREAWETITMSASRPALHVIDAANGKVLFRQSLSDDAQSTAEAAAPVGPATATAFRYFPAAPKGGTQDPVDYTANGWLAPTAKKLSGNNTHTFADVNDDNAANRTEEIPPRRARSWDYRLVPFHLPNVSFCDNPYPCSWNPDVPFSWRTNRNQNAAQVFFFVNTFHDHLEAAPIGFTEAAGNFQTKNDTRKGKGRDAVEANTDDGANTANGLPDANHIDNANMDTPPDGQAPRMQMFLQHQPGTTYPDGDPFSPTNVGDEADTVYHEYTHGLSNRLVVDAAGRSTLGGVQAGAMGEAWSDWFAMDDLVAQGLQPDRAPDGDVVIFQYDGAGVALDRSQPIDCPVGSRSASCPGSDTAGPGGYTYGDYGKVDGTPEVHADGEIWTETLWDLRRQLGSTVTESLVTRAMELSPANPSFLDERNAILQADLAVFRGRHTNAIWRVFAHRGMGFFAGTDDGDDTAPVENFAMPPGPNTPKGSLTGKVADSVTGAPLTGALVLFGGHASGFPGDYSATTAADGTYRISGILAGTYPKVVATSPGYDHQETTITITAGTTRRDFALQRDWAASSGGATVAAFDGPDFSPDCGPDFAINQSLGSGWGSTSDLVAGLPGPDTPKSVTIALPKAITVSQIAVDPNATCGDGGSAATADFRVETSPDGTTWTVAASGVFGVADRGRLNPLTPAAGSETGVRFVRFTMIRPQLFIIDGGVCPGAFSGCDFMDMSEIEVFGS